MKRWLTYAIASFLMASATATVSFGADSNVRGMYVEQEKNPTVQNNTGICYWLELDLDGEKKHCTNKTTFHNGDKLRIHVKPNVDGFALAMQAKCSQLISR